MSHHPNLQSTTLPKGLALVLQGAPSQSGTAIRLDQDTRGPTDERYHIPTGQPIVLGPFERETFWRFEHHVTPTLVKKGERA